MIKLNDFRRIPDFQIREINEQLRKVVESGWYILGQRVEEFEKKFACFMNVTHAVGVGNGMDAIEILLRSAGIGPGDEVLCPAMTAFPSVLAIIRAGATPVIVDIDLGSALMDIKDAERKISEKTKAIIIVHLYGHISKMSEWTAFCERYGLALIEDCAQSHLAKENGKAAGTFGVGGAFSFYPTKNLGAMGDGGMIGTNLAAISDKSRILRDYGQESKYEHVEVGLNSRLDEIQAAILSCKISTLESEVKRRRSIADYFHKNIKAPSVELLNEPVAPENHVYHLFVIKCVDREKLKNYLSSKGVQTGVHYPVPVHRQRAYTKTYGDTPSLPSAELYSNVCLTLPCHPYLTDVEVDKIVAEINSFY